MYSLEYTLTKCMFCTSSTNTLFLKRVICVYTQRLSQEVLEKHSLYNKLSAVQLQLKGNQKSICLKRRRQFVGLLKTLILTEINAFLKKKHRSISLYEQFKSRKNVRQFYYVNDIKTSRYVIGYQIMKRFFINLNDYALISIVNHRVYLILRAFINYDCVKSVCKYH